MKKIPFLNNLLKHKDYSTKVQIYWSSKAAGDAYDGYEQNYVFTNLNPITIKAYVRTISPESTHWKGYGLFQSGMKEIITEKAYKNYFLFSNKIVIDGDEYQVFKSGTGNNVTILDRPFNMIRVTVSRIS